MSSKLVGRSAVAGSWPRVFGLVRDHEATGAARPLIYGYLRVTDQEPDEKTRRAERELWSFAAAEGFCLAAIFHEHDPGSHAAFHELTEELRRTQARHVIVPSLAHLSPHPLLRDAMLTHLQLHANAQVLAVTPSADAVKVVSSASGSSPS